MMNLFKKLFRFKMIQKFADNQTFHPNSDELAILNAIEENAAHIKYQYGAHGGYAFHIFTISKPTPRFFLCAVSESKPGASEYIKSYHFEQYDNNNIIVSVKDGNATEFSSLVYSKVFDAFVEQHGGIQKKLYKQKTR